MRATIARATLRGATATYRGHITPPLDYRWLVGGWTAHFIWENLSAIPQLDVFSVAPRASSDWTTAVRGLFIDMQIVAEMKRTDRAKDWPFCDALGVKMIESGDLSGWLPQCPILDYGIESLIDEAKMVTSQLHSLESLQFLPEATKHFCGLKRIPLN